MMKLKFTWSPYIEVLLSVQLTKLLIIMLQYVKAFARIVFFLKLNYLVILTPKLIEK